MKWEKRGRVFEPQAVTGRSWLKHFAQGPATLLFDDFVRVYFSCRPDPDANRQFVSYSAFADFSRQDPTKCLRVSERPILDLGGKGCFDEFGTYPVSVARDGKKVRAYFGGWTRCESVPFDVEIGVAESDDDGVTFRRLGPGPVLSFSPDEPFILSGPKIRRFDGGWQLFYIAGRRWVDVGGKPEPVYKIRMATSADGLNWTKHGKDLIGDRLGVDEAQASPDVFFHGGRYHMFFCYRQASDFRLNKDRSYRIGYATSVDLQTWTRDDDRVGIDVSPDPSAFDAQMVAYPHVFELDGQVYMQYLGNEVGKYGFGLARLVSWE